MSSANGAYKIRPAGRHLLTIGRDLIQNNYAAIVELVKNAYDADSKDVEIHFSLKEKSKNIQKASQSTETSLVITIKDHGHGMSRDTVINEWLVPSTKDKLKRKLSPNGRVMQGRKGIGRYAASMLGSTLLLETVSTEAEKTTVLVDWQNFEKAEYLDDVEILVESNTTDEKPGTILTIEGGVKYYEEWNEKQFNTLQFELKKLIPPITNTINKAAQNFEIYLKISGFPDIDDIEETITPFPIFDLYDYKISGVIGPDGKGSLSYAVQKAKNTVQENIDMNLNQPTGCGSLKFDIRVYDREPESITELIKRGLKNEAGDYVGKLEARQILNISNGIGVYRNGFRIRPLGDPEFDWLKLNEQRVQNPSLRIGSNQVIGYVLIESEEQSNLIENSARDGLRENNAYRQLREITKKVIAELESRRFSFRQKVGLRKTLRKIEQNLEKILSLDRLKSTISSKLISSGVSVKSTAEIINLINEEVVEKNKTVEEIRQTIATYQGQATLGKIMTVVLHEGRKPLNFFRNEIPRIDRFIKEFQKTKDFANIDEIIDISKKTEINAKILSDLFKRLDPLAVNKRPAKTSIDLEKIISKCFAIFRQQMDDNQIYYQINGNATINAWTQDIHAIFTNLIENSIYWLSNIKTDNRHIIVNLVSEEGTLSYIDFKDTGPGIESSLIENKNIFEPEFTTKPQGTGIGLSIAGEAAKRNGLKLTALEYNQGAYFRLMTKGIEDE